MIKGINQNTNPEETPKDYIYWGKNGLSNKQLDASINENGNKVTTDLSSLNILFKNGVVVLGDSIIYFYKDTSNNDCIAVHNETTNTIIVKVTRTDFNFQIDKPITGRAKINPNNELVVAFVDGFNTDKYINLDTASPIDSLNFYNLFPLVNNASKIETQILDSGALTTGAYFITFQYISKDRTRSTWTTISNPVYITTIDPTQSYVTTKGVKSGAASSKSIKVTLKDIDTNYSKVAIAVISKINGVTSSKIIKEVSINSSNLSFIYNGTESLGTITIDELITDNVIYTSSRHITSLDDQLFLADVKAPPTEDFQLIANQTIINWRSTLDTVNSVSASSKFKDGNNKTFIHDEVYDFYIQFELITGSFTEWFHIPGREVTSGEQADASVYMGGLQINGRNPKVYEVLDTCSYSGGINIDGTKSGVMGGWENENEVYPSNFPPSPLGVLAGQRVRHHKFPSIDFMLGYVWFGSYGSNTLDTLGIDVVVNGIDSTKIKGYRIGYAKRTLADVGILGQGLTIFSGYPEGGDVNYLLSTAGNFVIGSQDTAGDDILQNKNYLRFNSFDLLEDKPAISSSYLRNYIRLKANKLCSTASGYNGGITYGEIHAGSGSYDLVAYASNFTVYGANNTINSNVASGDKIRKLSAQTYVPNNIKYQQDSITVDNRCAEETVLAKIEGTNLDLTTFGTVATKTNDTARDAACAEETYLSALKSPKSDYFLGFENQTIVVNSQIIRGTSNGTFTDIGDGFIGVHTFVTLAAYNNNDATITDPERGVVNFKIHVGVSRHNVNLRYQVLGDYSTYFYPDSGLFTKAFADVNQYWFYTNARNNQWNQFQYSKDFSSINDFEVFGIYNRDNPDLNNFNFRIVRSTRASRENSLEDGWKTFKPLDYFDTVRDKGRITNLESWGTDALIIHHERAIFRTRDKAVLQTNVLNVTLGSGDIFAIEPKEENPTSYGVGGTQHKFSCLLTELGYMFVDEQTRVVYLYDGNELKDIGEGLRLFFMKYFDCKKDNPFNDQGIVLAYENTNDRILLSQKAVSNFTVSYDLVKREWAFSHDFTPDYMFNTRSNLYSFKVNTLYTHNIGNKGSYYGTVYPFYVDYVINDSSQVQKVLSEISWISKYKQASNNTQQRFTITSITIWNDQHCTGKIDLTFNNTKSLFIDSNTKLVDETWSFDKLYNLVIDDSLPFIDDLLLDSRPLLANIKSPVWYDSEPLRGKFFIVRLEFSNIENKELHLRELLPLIRKSHN